MVVVAASKMIRNATFTHLKVPARSTKTVKEECAQQLNDIVLAKPYKLGFSNFGSDKLQLNPYSSRFF
jgi:hypothetical protein